MRKKSTKTRLDLRRETVRTLSAGDLAKAQGGLPDDSISNSTKACTTKPPDTYC